jgi:hypothetical protein
MKQAQAGVRCGSATAHVCIANASGPAGTTARGGPGVFCAPAALLRYGSDDSASIV